MSNIHHQSNSLASNTNEINLNENNDSTLSSSNSFDAMESEPISTGSCNPQATSSKSYKLDSNENSQLTNGISQQQRKGSLTSALTESAKHNLLNVRNTSKSMTNIVDKNRNEEDKENESSDELFNNSEIEAN